jgi:hypothetical protein
VEFDELVEATGAGQKYYRPDMYDPKLGIRIIPSRAAQPSTLINLSCSRMNQFAVRIERAEKCSLVQRHVGLNSLQRISIDASALMKNDASIALSCPQKRTARRVAS